MTDTDDPAVDPSLADQQEMGAKIDGIHKRLGELADFIGGHQVVAVLVSKAGLHYPFHFTATPIDPEIRSLNFRESLAIGLLLSIEPESTLHLPVVADGVEYGKITITRHPPPQPEDTNEGEAHEPGREPNQTLH